jgi:UDP:flavonoid glycosyltransferase YjiC (YdhE family)
MDKVELRMSPLPGNCRETPLQGDAFLLRSVPALERDIDELPSRVHFIGAAIEPLQTQTPDLNRWLGDCPRTQCLYVQEGRTFGSPGFLDVIIDTFAETSTRVIVDCANTEVLPQQWPSNFFARRGICESAILPRCGALVATGHSTAVLSAICHGVPMLLFPSGSGTTDIAARCVAAGIAIVGNATSMNRASLLQYIDALCHRTHFYKASDRMKREFAAFDSPTIAAELLEVLGTSRLPVPRKTEATFM